jgi:predicted regulator of Ras-like GTPase activity (Roadblock/LC7/MglB family)
VPASEETGSKESQAPKETPLADTPIRFPGRNTSPPATPPPPAATSVKDTARSTAPDRAESVPTAPAAPRMPTSAAPSGGASEPFVNVRVRDLAAHWPEAVRSLLESRLTPDAVVRLPVEEVEPGLKAGRISMTWAKIRSYLIAAPEGLMTEWDNEKMALPLSVLAPAFLAQRRGTAEKARAVVPALAEQIPDVFAGPGSNRLADKGSGGATAPTAGSAKAGGSTQKYGAGLTPNAMVEEMTRVAGVSGALLVSGDGLWIAASLPEGVGKEAVAALVPSIHQRLVDFCREVKGGELSKVLLQVGDRSVLLVPVDTHYLVVLGGVGKTMPEKEMMVFLQRLDRTPATR